MITPTKEVWTGEETLEEHLARHGVSRRKFLKFCGAFAAVLGTGSSMPAPGHARIMAERIAAKLGEIRRPVVVWLQLQECTGCMESTLRSGDTDVSELILNLVSMDYNELLMAAAGHQAEEALEKANEEPHLLVVNGSIPLGEGGAYCTIGGKSAQQVLEEASRNATAILAVGACAHYGCVQAARPNPTGAVGVSSIITDKPVVNIAGCPPIGEVITATIMYYLVHGKTPPTDSDGRPLFAYRQRIHNNCPRRASYDAGQFVESFDDDAARQGYCLYKVGCKGPAAFAACPVIEWNLGTSFPIKAGHPCIGCTERHFFDRMTPFYERLPDLLAPGVGVESTANKIGVAVTAGAVAGVAAHSIATIIQRNRRRKDADADLKLAVFGDETEDEETAADEEEEKGDQS